MSKQQYNTAYGWPISHLRAQQATQPQLLNEFIGTMPAPFQKAVRKLLTGEPSLNPQAETRAA